MNGPHNRAGVVVRRSPNGFRAALIVEPAHSWKRLVTKVSGVSADDAFVRAMFLLLTMLLDEGTNWHLIVPRHRVATFTRTDDARQEVARIQKMYASGRFVLSEGRLGTQRRWWL